MSKKDRLLCQVLDGGVESLRLLRTVVKSGPVRDVAESVNVTVVNVYNSSAVVETALLGEDASDVPTAFVAVTVKV
jgi:hypothetical protein